MSLPLSALGTLSLMPPELLHMVYLELYPQDLLCLSRTCKTLIIRHELLSRERSRSTWVAVLENVYGLPPCPSDMSEPAYAHLCTSDKCFFCSRTQSRHVYWRFRMRCCAPCAKKRLVTWNKPEPLEDLETLRRDQNPAGEIVFLRSEAEEMIYGASANARRKILEEKAPAMSAIESISPDCILSIYDHKIICKQHAEECAEWHDNQVMYMIRGNIIRCGMDKRLHKMEPTHWDALLKACVPYTKAFSSAWPKVKERVLEWIGRFNSGRDLWGYDEAMMEREQIILEFLDNYRASRPKGEIVPYPLDVFRMPMIQKIVESVHPEDDFPPDAFNEIFDSFGKLCEEWTLAVGRSILLHEPKPCWECKPSTDRTLRLATTWFSCNICATLGKRAYMLFPIICDHECALNCIDMPESNEVSECMLERISEERWNITYRGWPYYWHGTWHEWGDYEDPIVQLDDEAGAAAALVVSLCAMQPESATTAEMDELNVRIVCCACGDAGEMVGLTWKLAVSHGLENPAHTATYVVASAEQREKIVQTEDLSLELATLSSYASPSKDDDSVCSDD